MFAQFIIFYTESHAGTFELAEGTFGSSTPLPRVATRVAPFFACQESQPATLVTWIALPSALQHGHSVDVLIHCHYVTTGNQNAGKKERFSLALWVRKVHQSELSFLERLTLQSVERPSNSVSKVGGPYLRAC